MSQPPPFHLHLQILPQCQRCIRKFGQKRVNNKPSDHVETEQHTPGCQNRVIRFNLGLIYFSNKSNLPSLPFQLKEKKKDESANFSVLKTLGGEILSCYYRNKLIERAHSCKLLIYTTAGFTLTAQSCWYTKVIHT